MGFFGDLLRKQRPNSARRDRPAPTAVTRPSMPVMTQLVEGMPSCWLESAALTDVGLVRSNNEDNVRLLPEPALGVSLALLADGMGGHASGEVASTLALESMMASYQQRQPHQPLSSVLPDAVVQANRAVWSHALEHPETSGMGTTLCAIAFDPGQGIHFCWVGDSRIYRLTEGGLQLLTRDDTLVNHLLDEGLLTAEQAENHPDAHVLSQALGTHEALQKINVARLSTPAKLGEVFLLTSDGVHDVLTSEAMGGLLGKDDVHQVAQALIEAAKEAGSTDNLSAVVVRVAIPKNRQTPLAATRF
jgi:PPM family protein phosphatase